MHHAPFSCTGAHGDHIGSNMISIGSTGTARQLSTPIVCALNNCMGARLTIGNWLAWKRMPTASVSRTARPPCGPLSV